MKKNVLLLLAVVLVSSCNIWGTPGESDISEFKEAFKAINFSLRGKLIRHDYHGDLSSLTFDRYLEEMKKEESERVEMVLSHLNTGEYKFQASKNTFEIYLRSEKFNYLIYDDAYTIKIDRVVREVPLPSISGLHSN